MKIYEKIADMLVDGLIPYQQYITSPVNLTLPNQTRVGITDKSISLFHSSYTAEHFEVTIFSKEDVYVQHRPEFKGLFMKDIISDIEVLLNNHIPNLNDNKEKAQLIVKKMNALQKELEECSTT